MRACRSRSQDPSCDPCHGLEHADPGDLLCCGWLQDGTVARLEQEKRRDAIARQRIVSTVLPRFEMVRHPASYFVWLPLPAGVRSDAVAMRLKEDNVLVSTAAPYAVGSQPPHAIRLALGSVSHADLKRALEKVSAIVAGLAD